jgi:hypothetical protein
VVRFDKDRVAPAQFLADQSSYVPKIRQCRDPNTVVFCEKAEIIHCVMRHREWLKIDIANAKVSIRFDLNSPFL